MQRSTIFIATLVGVLLISVTCSLALWIQNFSQSSEYHRTLSEQSREIKDLKDHVSDLETQLNKQKEFVDSRRGFLDALDDAKSALIKADGVVDTVDTVKLIKESQEVVYRERGTPGNIDLETEKVAKETGTLLARVGFTKNYDELTDDQVMTMASLSSEVSGLRILPATHPARQALDAVGGKDILLGAAPVVCGREDSMACAYQTKVILIAEQSANEDYEFYYPVMMHEYAHQAQFPYITERDRSSKFDDLFNSDIEWLTDCMAAARIPNYSSNYQYECSAEQVAYGANAWNGIFP